MIEQLATLYVIRQNCLKACKHMHDRHVSSLILACTFALASCSSSSYGSKYEARLATEEYLRKGRIWKYENLNPVDGTWDHQQAIKKTEARCKKAKAPDLRLTELEIKEACRYRSSDLIGQKITKQTIKLRSCFLEEETRQYICYDIEPPKEPEGHFYASLYGKPELGTRKNYRYFKF